MNKILKVIVAVPAILFLIIGLRWLVAPAGVAGEFGMPLLDGLGRSTQIAVEVVVAGLLFYAASRTLESRG